jgi:hypothetical protein
MLLCLDQFRTVFASILGWDGLLGRLIYLVLKNWSQEGIFLGITYYFAQKKLTRETQMVANTSLEERLAAVEAAIAELQKQVVTPQTTNWLQQITGSFKDEPAFEEVLAYGRAIREGDESLLEIQDES